MGNVLSESSFDERRNALGERNKLFSQINMPTFHDERVEIVKLHGSVSSQSTYNLGRLFKYGGLAMALFTSEKNMGLYMALAGVILQAQAYGDSVDFKRYTEFADDPENAGKTNPYTDCSFSIRDIATTIPKVILPRFMMR